MTTPLLFQLLKDEEEMAKRTKCPECGRLEGQLEQDTLRPFRANRVLPVYYVRCRACLCLYSNGLGLCIESRKRSPWQDDEPYLRPFDADPDDR